MTASKAALTVFQEHSLGYPPTIPTPANKSLGTPGRAHESIGAMDQLSENARELKYQLKYKELKKRVREIEEENDFLTVKLARARRNLARLRAERGLLFEKLESTDPEEAEEEYPDGGGESDDSSMRLGTPPPTVEVVVPSQVHAASEKSQSSSANAPPGSSSKKPEKDPNAPKRPTNAFFLYCQIVRNQIREENPNANLSDLTKNLGVKWKMMSAEEKKQYYDMYDQDKERYQKELAIYTSKTEGEATSAVALAGDEGVDDSEDTPILRQRSSTSNADHSVTADVASRFKEDQAAASSKPRSDGKRHSLSSGKAVPKVTGSGSGSSGPSTSADSSAGFFGHDRQPTNDMDASTSNDHPNVLFPRSLSSQPKGGQRRQSVNEDRAEDEMA